MALTENRRIFWNIIFTYGRSLLAIGGTLFISRWVLMALGQVDFGLFSVIGGLVVFIQFLNNVLAGATARFYAFSIGAAKVDQTAHGLEECRKWFNTAITIHTVLPLCLIIIGYPIAKWAIYNWLTIPPDRMDACVWVLRFTCLSSFVGMVNVPFMAMYTAKQYIAELTVYSMATTILNIIFAYFMASHPGTWLVKYALWMCAMSVLPQLIICIRANLIFQECKLVYAYMGNITYLKQIGGYVCWTALGHMAGLFRSQGISLLINKTFGPRVNASMQVAHQVNAGTSTLASALLKAFAPAITTAAGAKDYKRMQTLAFGSCKFSTLLALIFVIPLVVELPYVIKLWLKTPPPFTVGLCYFMLTSYICGVCTNGNMTVINASGQIRDYHIVLSFISFCILPAAILAVYLGGGVYSIGAILVVGSCLNSTGRIYFAQKILDMSAKRWIKEIMLPILALIAICVTIAYLPHLWMKQGFIRLLVATVLAEGIFFPLTWKIILIPEERDFIASKLIATCKRLSKKYKRLAFLSRFAKDKNEV
ncbi:MAG: hypothetical protein J6X06_04880 [Elusimicrobiaceae bacterium]|nr:hypothetical protein [Elusimicrobiaceae bacterium]